LTIKPVGETFQANQTIQELVKKKMHFQEFKRRLTG